MSVIAVEELHDERKGSINRLWQRTYTRVFRVTTNTRTDGPVVCFYATDPNTGVTMPRNGQYYAVSSAEFDLGAWVNNVAPAVEEMAGSGSTFRVTVDYGPYDTSVFVQNPLDWPTIYWYTREPRDKVITEDISGNPIWNSAKERFADPVTRPDYTRILNVRRNEAIAAYDDSFADNFRNTRNAAIWNKWPIKSVYCLSIEPGEPQYDSNAQIWFWTVLYRFAIDTIDLHNKILLDCGYSYLDTSTPPKQIRIQGGDGQSLAEPALLDGSGHQLATSGTPVYKTFEIIPTSDFTQFNIDLSKCLGR